MASNDFIFRWTINFACEVAELEGRFAAVADFGRVDRAYGLYLKTVLVASEAIGMERKSPVERLERTKSYFDRFTDRIYFEKKSYWVVSSKNLTISDSEKAHWAAQLAANTSRLDQFVESNLPRRSELLFEKFAFIEDEHGSSRADDSRRVLSILADDDLFELFDDESQEVLEVLTESSGLGFDDEPEDDDQDEYSKYEPEVWD